MMRLQDIIETLDESTVNEDNDILCIEYIIKQDEYSIHNKSLMFFFNYLEERNEMIYHWFTYDYNTVAITAMGNDYHDLLSDDNEYDENSFSVVDSSFAGSLSCFIDYIDANNINEVSKARRFLNSDNSQKKINNKRYKRV